MGIFLTLCIMINILFVNADVWEDPPLLDAETPGVTFGISSIIMQENLEDTVIALINYKGSTKPTIKFLIPPEGDTITGLFVKQNDVTKYWEIIVKNKQDFESNYIKFDFGVYLLGDEYVTILQIENVNDIAPQITATHQECEIEEYSFTVDCQYSVTDEDGMLNDVTWTINGESNHEIFEFKYNGDRPIPVAQKTMVLELALKKQLDFKEASLHIIDLQVSDGLHSARLRIVINVQDIPNKPPVWNKIFQSQEFDEKESQTFEVQATDGDIIVNDDIIYSITFQEKDWSKYISVEENTGEINVKEIDRDYEQWEMYKFVIKACEVNWPQDCISQPVTFIVNDKNDNAPTFTLKPDGGNYLQIEEAKISTINTRIDVSDIDLGENARYSLQLVGDRHQEAFSVAPSSGYQHTTVDLFIVDAALLDYEKDGWRQFQFELQAIEDNKSNKTLEPVVFTIELINRNDELPIFQSCDSEHAESESDACVIEIEETFKGETYLVTMLAEDKDIDGSVTHELMGTYANRILTIDSTTGEIFTRDVNRPFDYETLPEVIIQVRAEDSLPGDDHVNVVLAQLTIKLIDVNDETPRLYVEQIGNTMKENREDGYDTGFEIIATDEDSNADLEVLIDWENTYAIKNGIRVGADEFKDYMGFVQLDIDPQTLTGKYVSATLRLKEVVVNNTPDFELFDTAVLQIIAIDKNQRDGDDRVSLNVHLYIDNVNDNIPVFTDTIHIERRVTENASPTTLIGFVSAKDDDVGDQLKYFLEPRNNTDPDLIEIDEATGQLLVVGDIDADKPVWYLYYTVTVTDDEHPVSEEIEIYVVDVNDLNPNFINAGETIVIPVTEGSPDKTEIRTFTAIDGDREEVNNKVTYSISTTTNAEYRSFFAIDEETGLVYVSYANPDQTLDRDNAIPDTSITIIIDARDVEARSGSLTFTIELQDINNKKPELETKTLSVGEEVEKDYLIGIIRARDADKPNTENSMINFEIISIEEQSSNKPSDLTLFVLEGQDKDAGTVNLRTGTDLKGFFDEYKVTLKMNDFGTDPEQQTTEDYLIVTIDRYNFYDPVFIHPSYGQLIHLSKSQVANQPLQVFGGGSFGELEADDLQEGKFHMSYTIEDQRNLITLMPSGLLLTVTTAQDLPINTRFDVTITATAAGRPEKSTSNTVTFIFVDENVTPSFSTNDYSITDFWENKLDQEQPFPKADYNIEDIGIELSMYYILETRETPFSIRNNDIPKLYLEGPLDREVQSEYTVVVQASSSPNGIVDPDPEARLTITINLKDENDNRPAFEDDIYYAIFLFDEVAGAVVTKVRAIDPDEDDRVSYSITNTNDANASPNFPRFDITISGDYAEIKLTTAASTTNTGYVILTITAQDGDPDHDTDVDVEIYVVSPEENIVKFKFKNEVEDVEIVKNEIIPILMRAFKSPNGVPYEAYIKRITANTEDEDGAAPTVVEVYFIDTENHTPLRKGEIEPLANDVTTYEGLRQDFAAINLNLVSFSTNDEEDDDTIEVLRAWLIGVSVVLGCLCVLLIVAFVLKTRSLTSRLNKLSVTKYGSQESGLNRKVVPNTNRNALEGSNPVFNDGKTMPEFDRQSISSGDSDLIGVENNPDFQRKPEKSGLH